MVGVSIDELFSAHFLLSRGLPHASRPRSQLLSQKPDAENFGLVLDYKLFGCARMISRINIALDAPGFAVARGGRID